MKKNLLTIIIPTYNRANYLEKLLGFLLEETKENQSDVRILVSNNASTDGTKEVINSYHRLFKNFEAINHPINIGPDENFASCIEHDKSMFFWLLGDDDLPRAGLIYNLVKILKNTNPDLVCLKDSWVNDIYLSGYQESLTSPKVLILDKLNFSKLVNARVTFISVIIVKRETYINSATHQEIRKHKNTSLIHLGWILNNIKLGSKFIYINDISIFATSGNSGGYNAIKVFCQNFPTIVKNEFGEHNRLSKVMRLRSTLRVAITIAWALRKGTAGDFIIQENSDEIKPDKIGLLTHFLISSIVKKPILIAASIRFVCILLYSTIKIFDILNANIYSKLASK